MALKSDQEFEFRLWVVGAVVVCVSFICITVGSIVEKKIDAQKDAQEEVLDADQVKPLPGVRQSNDS